MYWYCTIPTSTRGLVRKLQKGGTKKLVSLPIIFGRLAPSELPSTIYHPSQNHESKTPYQNCGTMSTFQSAKALAQSAQRRFAIGNSQRSYHGYEKVTASFTKPQGTSPRNLPIRKHQQRSFAYAAVQHDTEYKNALESSHGQQLQLALKEAEKYEVEAVDPFELYKIDEDETTQDIEDNDESIQEGAEENDNEDSDVDAEDEDEDEESDFEEEFEAGQGQVISNFSNNGHVRRTKAELAALKAGAPAGGKFAIIDLNGSQQKVTVDDVVIVNKLKPVNNWAVGSTHTLNAEDGQVLLLGSQDKTLVGLPFVNGGEVDVMVEEITRDKKLIIFKKKRRKNYRRKNGFRREVTFLRVLDIRFP